MGVCSSSIGRIWDERREMNETKAIANADEKFRYKRDKSMIEIETHMQVVEKQIDRLTHSLELANESVAANYTSGNKLGAIASMRGVDDINLKLTQSYKMKGIHEQALRNLSHVETQRGFVAATSSFNGLYDGVGVTDETIELAAERNDRHAETRGLMDELLVEGEGPIAAAAEVTDDHEEIMERVQALMMDKLPDPTTIVPVSRGAASSGTTQVVNASAATPTAADDALGRFRVPL